MFQLRHLFMPLSSSFENSYRCINFFNKTSAEKLWKGLTTVSNSGKKKGRGKFSKKNMGRNLNHGQRIGDGRINMLWPGLNSPVIRGKEIVRQKELPPNTEREERILEIRNRMGKFRANKIDILSRGWSGVKLPGQDLGPPDNVGENSFDGFKTIALEYKFVSTMDGKLGRKRSISLFAVTGNGNGLAGFALARGNLRVSCIRQCKNKAAQRLMYINRCDNHTVFHNFYTKYLFTKIYVERKPEGYGLQCHRVIKEICKVVGIKNLYARVDGSTNPQNLTKAFFLGLLNQKTHQQLANEKNLSVVRIGNNNVPRVMAVPEDGSVRSISSIKMDEEINFDLYTMGGQVMKEEREFVPFYVRLPTYERYLKKQEHRRNRKKIIHQQLVEYGEVVSFLKEKYPECDRRLLVVEEED